MSDYNAKEEPLTLDGKNILDKLSDELNLEIKWDYLWDGLFWRFMYKNKTFLKQNPRLGMLVKSADKNLEKIKVADRYLKLFFEDEK